MNMQQNGKVQGPALMWPHQDTGAVVLWQLGLFPAAVLVLGERLHGFAEEAALMICPLR